MLSKIEEGAPVPCAVIFGLAGESLTPEEAAFFKDTDPLGFILFARNCQAPDQVRTLVRSLHECLEREAPVLIDQEGGRVQRLKPPQWDEHPPARQFGDLFLRDFARGRQALIENTGSMTGVLAGLGVSVNCAPVLDVLSPETHDAIGDRAFSADPEMVALLGALVCDYTLRSGIIPVVKHMPGQGRAASDSHKDLPLVEASRDELRKTDFLPFKELLTKVYSEPVWGMVAHVIYKELDARAPASCSRPVIWDIIRKEIGFQGLLLSDDICMEALAYLGDAGARAEQALRAGCDVVLHCNGDPDEMKTVAARAQKMTNGAVMRYNRAVAWVHRNYTKPEE